ncbi:ABC transporter ATP-binding protein [Litchfieldia salsa]|uniref:NitT/TauT family transport system ATP-binding protein n=1 Tax=Litchfieldia salsa TaxID=930152 RepID=A0A1H0QFX7_9BACI|nr:ABC transporter ATP-binding protein [Litchfieldia salsa]SDP15626.1 NitT/TauT family transport system ATP-binding protein [Litchfieldia salsa]
MDFLTISNIHHTYFTKDSAKTALEDITLSIKEGEFVSFLGPSGCGKTTLLSIISGLITPTSGKVEIENKPVNRTHSSIGYMLQEDYLFPWKTIKENILVGLKTMNILDGENEKKALSLLKEIGLSGVEESYPKQLSGGMRQRAALVRTLTTNPKILLLDEPFSALDFQTKLKLEDLVSTTLKDYNKTALLVTHDIGEAIAMSDKIFLLSANPGKVAKVFDIPKELKDLLPFEARQHPEYSSLFQEIWKELDQFEA